MLSVLLFYLYLNTELGTFFRILKLMYYKGRGFGEGEIDTSMRGMGVVLCWFWPSGDAVHLIF